MSTKYEVWMTSDRGSIKYDYEFHFLNYAEKYLDDKEQNHSKEYTSAFIIERESSNTLFPKIVATRNYRDNHLKDFKYLTSCPPYNTIRDPGHSHVIKDPGHSHMWLTPSSSTKDVNMTIYTVVITDLNDKFLGVKSDIKTISLVNDRNGGITGNGLTVDQVPSSIGKAFYYKEGRLEPKIKYIDGSNEIDWVRDLFKTPPAEEWTNWSMTPPPHLSIVMARRYGAGEIEVDTKCLPFTFDPHGMEWKVKN